MASSSISAADGGHDEVLESAFDRIDEPRAERRECRAGYGQYLKEHEQVEQVARQLDAHHADREQQQKRIEAVLAGLGSDGVQGSRWRLPAHTVEDIKRHQHAEAVDLKDESHRYHVGLRYRLCRGQGAERVEPDAVRVDVTRQYNHDNLEQDKRRDDERVACL